MRIQSGNIFVMSLLLALLLPPLLGIVLDLLDSGLMGGFLPDARQTIILGRSLLLAGAASILATILGVPVGIAITQLSSRWKAALLTMQLLALVTPPYIHAIAWIQMFSNDGLLASLKTIIGPPEGIMWTLWVYVLSFAPLIVLMTWMAVTGQNKDLLNAGHLYQKPGRVFLHVTMPLMKPYILAGSVLVFILVFTDYGVPSHFSVNTFPVEVFIAYSAELIPRGILKGLIPMMIIGPLALMFHFRLIGKRPYYHLPESSNSNNKRSRTAALIPILLISIITVILPLTQLILTALPFAQSIRAIRASFKSMLWSMGIATSATLFVVALLSLYFAFIERDTTNRFLKTSMWWLLIMPISIPGTALGIGMIHIYNTYALSVLYRTPLILVIGSVIICFPITAVVMRTMLKQIPPEIYHATGQVSTTWYQKLRHIFLPLLLPRMSIIAVLCILLVLRELGLAVMIVPPGVELLSVRIDSFMHYGATSAVAALSLVLVLFSMFLVMVTLFIVRKKNA